MKKVIENLVSPSGVSYEDSLKIVEKIVDSEKNLWVQITDAKIGECLLRQTSFIQRQFSNAIHVADSSEMKETHIHNEVSFSKECDLNDVKPFEAFESDAALLQPVMESDNQIGGEHTFVRVGRELSMKHSNNSVVRTASVSYGISVDSLNPIIADELERISIHRTMSQEEEGEVR